MREGGTKIGKALVACAHVLTLLALAWLIARPMPGMNDAGVSPAGGSSSTPPLVQEVREARATPREAMRVGRPRETPRVGGPIPEALLQEHVRLCASSGADSCVVMVGDQIVSEWYGPAYGEPVAAMSSTKSITALLVGMLVDESRLDIQDRVAKYVPSWGEGLRSTVRIRHLLSHTSGLPNYKGPDSSVGYAGDKNAHVIALAPKVEAGTAFAYSNEGCQLLSPILDAAAGMPIHEYARDRLFRPLGLEHTRLRLDTSGHAWTYADMLTTPREFARFGRLMLQGGRWEGRQLISEAWIERCVKPSQSFREDCGLLWWIYKQPAGFGTRGYLNTDMYVFPAGELIVVRTQSKPDPRRRSPYRAQALPLFEKMLQALTDSDGATPSAPASARSAMEANRRGEWALALEQSNAALATRALPPHEQAEALYAKLYALARLGTKKEAHTVADSLEALRPKAPELVAMLLERAERLLGKAGPSDR